MDVFTTYQELEMYISGVLGVSKTERIKTKDGTYINPVNISDECLASKKGFDKFSFKKQKTKNR